MDEVKPLAKASSEFQKQAILKACADYPTSRKIAFALGISRATLYRLLNKHGIKRGVVNV